MRSRYVDFEWYFTPGSPSLLEPTADPNPPDAPTPKEKSGPSSVTILRAINREQSPDANKYIPYSSAQGQSEGNQQNSELYSDNEGDAKGDIYRSKRQNNAYSGYAYNGDALSGGAYSGDALSGGAYSGDAYSGGANRGDAYSGGAYSGDAYSGGANRGSVNSGDGYGRSTIRIVENRDLLGRMPVLTQRDEPSSNSFSSTLVLDRVYPAHSGVYQCRVLVTFQDGQRIVSEPVKMRVQVVHPSGTFNPSPFIYSRTCLS